MALPAWHTDELDEEWVESSPSPPPTVARPAPSEPLPQATADSIRLKRGSLRALGHSAPRALPPSRHVSRASDSPRIVSGHGQGRVLSEKLENGSDGLLSPPTSGNEGEAAGTFLVKEGVEDDRGRHLARKGRDMFGPSALEKMFRPPSPVIQPSTLDSALLPADSSPSGDQISPEKAAPISAGAISSPPAAHVRKPSHPYAPLNPSRLSKSVTPSSASSSFSATLPDAINITDLPELPQPEISTEHSDAPSQTSLIVDVDEGNRSSSAEPRTGSEEPERSKSEEVHEYASPLGRDGKYPFTFTAPHRSVSYEDEQHDGSPFNPDARPDETAHSTLPRQAVPQPGLRLFRGTFDTYTREHLSALVDSIAIEASPSPPRSDRQYSPEDAGSDQSRRSGSREAESEADSRSSKRMRMSPVSPARRAPGVRDWGAQGRAMMQRMRAMDDSTTSASHSRSDALSQSEGRTQEDDHPPSPARVANQTSPEYAQPDRPTHRSNPSTTSSGYLRRAEELMARIREMSTDASSSSPSEGAQTVDSRLPSNSSSDWGMAAGRGHIQAGQDNEAGPSRRSGLEERRPLSSAPSNPSAGQNGAAAVNIDDLNRFVSATTVATSTTISTSFVKHAGPRGNGPAAIRMIKPDDVAGVMPDRVGRMRFDKEQMRWVKDRNEGLGTVEELAEGSGSGSAGEARSARSRSEESEDVFAGIDSWGRDSRVSGPSYGSRRYSPENDVATQARGGEEADMDVETESSSSEDDDENVLRHANTTHIVEASDTDSSDSEAEGGPSIMPPQADATSPVHYEAHSPSQSPQRPAIHHIHSAPAVMTPVAGHLSLPRPMRSALRNAQSVTPAVQKKTSWLDHVTPGPGGSNERRSVSFSDGKKNGRMRDLHPEDVTNESDMTGYASRIEVDVMRKEKTIEVDDEWFRNGSAADGERSWLPSVRTKRIEGMFDQLGDLSLEAATPSKPPPRAGDSLVTSPEQINDAIDPDKTIRPAYTPDRPSRSMRQDRRQDPNATYLTECSFGVAHDKLVQVITDVYGSEPYWEELEEIDLSSKGVEGVAKMKEFLPAVRDVRLNDNKVSYLTGMPDTVHTLYVARNRLTSLSSFDHLRRLEVLDLSGNMLESVSHLACLTKLRHLTMDSNQIKSLEGVLQLDRLTHLRARGNKISVLDLSGATLPNLTNLDLADNRLSRLNGLEALIGVKEIILDGNRLRSVSSRRPLMSLRTVRASDNELASLDLASFPKIRTLYADGNRLSGLSRSDGSRSRLENLSLRYQEGAEMRIGWEELAGVRRLYLSGNPLPAGFFSSRPLKQLIYLELAACSLSTWPADLRDFAPNLEVFNVNYNFLQNLDGVKGLYRLRKLSCVGAKLGEGSRGVMRGLKGLSSLEEIDLRMNPSTLGFYLPLFLPSSPSSSVTEEHQQPMAHNPLPSVTLATIRPPDTPASKSRRSMASKHAAQPGEVEWNVLDAQFRKSLPNEWYSKRLVYRGLIMQECGGLTMLDGARVGEGERRKASRLLAAAREV